MPGRLLKLTGMLLLVLGSGAAALLWTHYRALTTPLPHAEPVDYAVEPGASLRQVALELGERGLLSRPEALVLHARWLGVAGNIQAGEYRIPPGTTPGQLLEMFVSGQVVQHSLTLVEGWTFREVMAAVREHPQLVHTLGDADPEEIMAHIGAPGVHPEGRFYPDTYHFPRGTTDVEFLRRAYQTMEERLQAEWAERAEGLPYENPDETLVMASIVEKETAVAEERARIAGVFVRRLQRGMRLETDPTVIYGMGADFDGDLRRDDLRRDTPYNTYLRKGLPPTPIAMPGGASIHAALHPAPGDALFFVARGDGTHHFSSTYREHRRAVARYQLGQGASAKDKAHE